MEHQSTEIYQPLPLPAPHRPDFRYSPAADMGALSSTYGVSVFFLRWAATIIDFLLFLFFSGALLISHYWSAGNAVYTSVTFLLLSVGVAVYYLVLEGLTGYTVGKFIMRIRVVNATGNPPGVFKALIRSSFHLFEVNPFFLGGLPAGLCVLLSEKKQRVGDMLAETYVVKVRDLPAASGVHNVVYAGACAFVMLTSVATGTYGIYVLAQQDSNSASSTMISGIKMHIFLSADKEIQISAPSDWSHDKELGEEGDIAISNSDSSQHVLALSESKDAYDNMTINDYQDMVERSVRRTFRGVRMLESPHHTDINGYPAVQFEFRGKGDGASYAHIMTIVETGTEFHRIHAWVPEADYEVMREELLDIIASFKEVDGHI
ncbi:RDD family protein [Paenibacillus xerothermodurans]|uniref:RDD family protein n=1 Tax=Paenibacillus xerothermodurans TaxID=1977292 RepID=A0A2W1NVT9_PAEXE|nr:RDD family protein [Paenibacillus xerothermodurans]PZE19802.1 RDD family protein [Paenibacillus xerothermodurans]